MMSDESKMVPIPEGALLTVTTGEYSNYYVDGVFRAKEVIDAEALLERWLSDHPEQRGNYNFQSDNFLAWVASLGLLEPLDCYEWHLSNYRSESAMTVEKMSSD